MDRTALIAELIELATALQTGCASDDERARLERLLLDEPAAAEIYLRFADDTVTLNELRFARGNPADAFTEPAHVTPGPLGKQWHAASRPLLAAAAAICCAVGAWYFSPTSLRETAATNAESHPLPIVNSPASSQLFARVLGLADADWTAGSRSYVEWERIGLGDSLSLDSGRVEILYDSGVQCVVEGPAKCVFEHETVLRADGGKLVARVSPEATGFRIVTPHTTLIDRGTSFGVSIERDQQTDVVVYEGQVDISLNDHAGQSVRQLEAGDALRVGLDGSMARITTVSGGSFLKLPSPADAMAHSKQPIIVAVSDNLDASRTRKAYQISNGGLAEDCPAYVDRRHQYNGVDARGLPPELRNADYVLTFNDHKVSSDLQIEVTLERPARLYILFDDRAATPEWLQASFTDTGWDVGLDEGYRDGTIANAIGPGNSIEQTLSVWARDVTTPGQVVLGPLLEEKTNTPPLAASYCMYGIAAAEMPVAIETK
jgi:hypothetical protein